jgi:hypothetical protein
MQRLSILLSIVFVFVFSQMAFGQTKWATYENARFDYSIAYPADLFTPQGEADNGDGQIFSGKSAEMRVFGSMMLLNETLLKEFNAVVKQHKNVSYKTYRKNFFVVSGTEDGRIFYQKTVARPEDNFLTFRIEYAADVRADYDKLIKKMADSFK